MFKNIMRWALYAIFILVVSNIITDTVVEATEPIIGHLGGRLAALFVFLVMVERRMFEKAWYWITAPKGEH
ncbi:hypothetical protein NS115_03790 [Paenibacillus jamilae]|uniref:Uncharacterized protein n=1 Tax=Paenibacillus jamilae TaxID=114136 RepID=A0ACC4ZZQ1_9BACL|nr:hypothetical protein [Paenibacillus jamilae]KTS84461.1 hypothetical protein NS115_03790 [Paenibacillus jamilae]